MRSDKSNKSKRIMTRGKKPYYLYKDTVMSKVSPFKPELITELVVVEIANALVAAIKIAIELFFDIR